MSTDPELIVTAVTGDVTLAGLIDTRIYPVVLPPDPTLPAITYQLWTQGAADFTQDGAEYRWPRWRFRIVSLRYSDLVPIAKALAGIFGDQARTPFASSWIEYPTGKAEDHETDTHRYWRLLDVVGFSVAGGISQ